MTIQPPPGMVVALDIIAHPPKWISDVYVIGEAATEESGLVTLLLSSISWIVVADSETLKIRLRTDKTMMIGVTNAAEALHNISTALTKRLHWLDYVQIRSV